MDLNHLFHRHQLSLMLGHVSPPGSRRREHVDSAAEDARRINAVQRALGATFAMVAA